MHPARRSPAFVETLNHLAFTILHHGYAELGTAWREEDTLSPYNRLYLVKDGTGEVRTRGRTVKLRPGHAYLFPLNVPLSFKTDQRLEKFFIHFNWRHLGFLDLFELLPPPVYERPLERGTFTAISRFDSGDLAHQVSLHGILQSLLAGFLGPATPETEARLRLTRSYQPLLEYVEGHLGPDLTVGKLSRALGVPAAGLSSRFHRDTGTPLKRFMTERLRLKAEVELASTGKKVREIAAALGFKDELYFSKFFKRETGFYPVAWRERRQGLSTG